MTKRTKSHISSQSQLPTQQQIAELHALLLESKDLASKINYPINAVLFSAIYKLPQYLLTTDSTEAVTRVVNTFFYEWLALSEDSPIPMLTLFIAAPFIFYFYKQIFDLTAALVKYIFPNGFTFKRDSHDADKVLQKLSTRQELAETIESLKKLIEQQKSSANNTFYASLVTSLAIPFLSSFMVTKNAVVFHGGSFVLKQSLLGPRFIYESGSGELIPKFIESVAGDQQGLRFYAAISTHWSNFNTPKQLKNYVDRLIRLSCLVNQQWEYNVKDPKNKALFCLKLMAAEISFQSQDGKVHSIASSLYLRELHRILLEEGIHVYATGKKALYVGHTPLSDKRAQKIKERLLTRLVIIKNQKNQAQTITAFLNSLVKELRNEITWQSQTEFNPQNQLQTYYYLDCEMIAADFLLPFRQALAKLVPDADSNISSDGSILKVKHFPLEKHTDNSVRKVAKQLQIQIRTIEANSQKLTISIEELSHASIQPRTSEFKPSQVSERDTTSTSLSNKPGLFKTPIKTRSSSESSSATKSVNTAIVQTQNLYPKTILFKSGLKRVNQQDIDPLAEDVIFPLDVPWLPKGRAYAAVDKRVYSAVSEFLEPKDIVDRLERGHVHGPKAAAKSKTGATGIQVTKQPYKDLDDVSHTRSAFKLKFTNNVRIFSDQVETIIDNTGEQRILYRFDGPCYGH